MERVVLRILISLLVGGVLLGRPAMPSQDQEDDEIADLVADLGSADSYHRKLARQALVKLGEAAVPALVGLLSSDKAVLRAEAAGTLGDMRRAAWSALPALEKLGADPIKHVRVAATEAVKKIRNWRGEEAPPAAEPAKEKPATIADLKRDLQNAEVQIAALQRVESIGPSGRVLLPELLQLLAQGKLTVQLAVLSALREVKPRAPNGVAEVVGFLGGIDQPASHLAFEVLCNYGADAAPLLLDRWVAGQIPDQPWVQSALWVWGAAVVPLLVVELTDASDPERRAIAATALAATGVDHEQAGVATQALIAALSDARAAVRRNAAIALGQRGVSPRETVPALVELLKRPRSRSRRECVQSLSQIVLHNRELAFNRTASERAVERAISDGLQWLAGHQDLRTGLWDSDEFFKHDHPEDPSGGPGKAEHDIATTGLAVRALLGAGHDSKTGRIRYAEEISMGLRFLMSAQRDVGVIGIDGQARIYHHWAATEALIDAWQVTRNPLHKWVAERALRYVRIARNPSGAWRYDFPPNGDNDTSVTSAMLSCLLDGTLAGLINDPQALAGGVSWVVKMTDPAIGRIGYHEMGSVVARQADNLQRFPTKYSECDTAMGLLCLLRAGQVPKTVSLSIDRCLAVLPTWDREAGTIDYVYWYYGTRALYEVGGTAWKTWSRAVGDALLEGQESKNSGSRRGSWGPYGAWGEHGGRLVSTALAVMSLQCVQGIVPKTPAGGLPRSHLRAAISVLRGLVEDEDEQVAEAAVKAMAAIELCYR